MPYVAKTPPFQEPEDRRVEIEERVMYGGGAISVNDEVFIWFSETQRGTGLAWMGTVEGVTNVNGGRRRVAIQLTRGAQGAFGIEDLRLYREVGDATPMGELSRKLFFHSHNKIAEVSAPAANVLRERFGMAS